MLFPFHCSPALRDLHSFPTRRSSDLRVLCAGTSCHVSQPCTGAPNRMISGNGDVVSALASLDREDRKSTRLNSSHLVISYAVFCLKKKKKRIEPHSFNPSH